MNNPKRALALVLCLVMLLTVFPMSVFAAEPLPFKDVQVGTWFYDDVAYAYEHDLMRGVGPIPVGHRSAVRGRGVIRHKA